MSFFRNETTGQVQPFFLVRIDFQDSVLITEHPVEQGADVSDHAQVRPKRFVVDCIVPETAQNGFANGVPQALAWYDAALGEPLTLSVDNEGVFTDVFLETGAHARTNIAERRFTLRLKQVRRPTALSVQRVVLPAQTTNPGAATKTSAGQQATEPTTVDSKLYRTVAGFEDIASALWPF